MRNSIDHPKVSRRTQQQAQKHIDYQAKPSSSGSRSNMPENNSTTMPPVMNSTYVSSAYAAHSRRVNARTILSAGTVLALLTGGQAAAALVDSRLASPTALAPNRRARRMLQTPSTSVTDAPPPPPANPEPTVSIDILKRLLETPPPYSNSDVVAFVHGASIWDYVDFETQHLDIIDVLVQSACSDDVNRILDAGPPFSDADLIIFHRAASNGQTTAMMTQNPDYSTWLSAAMERWPAGPVIATPPPPPAVPPPPMEPASPTIPAGPPVVLAAAGAMNTSDFLDVWSDPLPQFTAGSGPLRLVGYNVALPGNVPCTTSEANFESVCHTTAANGGNTIRLFAFQTMGGPGNWQSFDTALSTARNHGLKVIWVMGNQWANCQNIEPGTASDGYHEPEWYETGYKLVGQGNTLSYRDFALATVERYKDDPTIAMWSLLNEAEAGTVVTGTTCPDEALASKAMTAFVADMSSAIRAVDPNHLLTLGTRGQSNNCGLQDDHYFSVQEPMDVLTLHSYAMTYDRVQNLSTQAKGAGKPLILSEHAQCDSNQFQFCQVVTEAAALQTRACEMSKVAVAFAGLGVAGEMAWYLQPPNGTADAYSINATDPLIARFKKFSEGGSMAIDEEC